MSSSFLETASNVTAAGQLLDARAVAEKLNCSPRTVFRLSKDGTMPPGIKLGTLRRWSEAEIDRWLVDGAKPVRPINGATSEAAPEAEPAAS